MDDLLVGVCRIERVPENRIVKKTDTSYLRGRSEAKDKEFEYTYHPQYQNG